MIVFKNIHELSKHIFTLKKDHQSIGFVPTMGALHQGHLSLIDQCKSKASITVASIFINPTQFNDPKDFEKYPVSIAPDIEKLELHECDILFLPSVSEMYPDGMQSPMHYDLGGLETLLEGEFRPGHFQGVAQVVHRLLNIVMPDYLFIGSKDYQQCLVIKKLVKLIGADVTVITGETFREESGLAMSSRNLRLSEPEKKQASAIYKALLFIKEKYPSSDFRELESIAPSMLLNNGFSKIDYVSIADAYTLQPAVKGETKKAVALIAAFIGDVRLIDNMVMPG